MNAKHPAIRPIAAFSDNYIWSLEWPDGNCAIVDPGDARPVLDHLRTNGLQLSAILVTHHHADHIGGIGKLLASCKVPVFGPSGNGIKFVDHPLAEGDSFVFGGIHFRVLEVPGHTLDHIAYVADIDGPVLFCGDTLFAGGCGRLFEGTPEMMYRSLQKLAQLPDATRVYCAHEYTLANLRFASSVEPDNVSLRSRLSAALETRQSGEPTVPSSLALERDTNPFLRCDSPAIVTAAQQVDPGANTPTAVFAAIRSLKNKQ